MDIDDALISKLETISKLSLSDEERAKLKVNLKKIIDMFDVIGKVDTSGVEPLIHMSMAENPLRDDTAIPSDAYALKKVLIDTDRDYIKVPRVVKT